MEEIREYLLRLVVCGILCGIAVGLTGKSAGTGKLVKLITGVCMLITIVSPVLQLRIGSFGTYFENIQADAESYVTDGENVTSGALRDIIKAKTQTYILDKANSFGASLAVEVNLNDDQMPRPSSVRISGNISPYGKRQLQNIIRDDLGIALEDQIWIG